MNLVSGFISSGEDRAKKTLSSDGVKVTGSKGKRQTKDGRHNEYDGRNPSEEGSMKLIDPRAVLAILLLPVRQLTDTLERTITRSHLPTLLSVSPGLGQPSP